MDTLKIICYGCSQKLEVSELEPFTRLMCPVCNTKLTVPKSFGNFLLEEILGKGELATAYRANDLTLDREIVVKALSDEMSAHPDVPQLYINEARMASAINHPNVIPIFSCGENKGTPYLVMQFMPGGGLHKQIDPDSPPPVADVCRWFMEAAKGLDSAAMHGMLHHDLRPSNIFLDMEGNIKIGDFGLLMALTPARPILRAGTPNVSLEQARYFSPERLRTGRQEVTGDIFSFGATFFHVLTGHSPYPGETVDAILASRRDQPTPSPRAHNSDIPPAVDKLLRRILATDPEERPSTYAEIVLILKDAVQDMHRKASNALPIHPPPRTPPSLPSSLPATRSRASTKVVSLDSAGRQIVRRPHPLVRVARIMIPVLVVVVALLLVYLLVYHGK
jgi:serine/threonine-protein kinase